MHHLARVVPLVHGVVDVEPFVALEADQLRVQQIGEDLGYFRLPHASFAFQEDGPAEPEGEEQRGGQATAGEVALPAERLVQVVDGAKRDSQLSRLSSQLCQGSLRHHGGQVDAEFSRRIWIADGTIERFADSFRSARDVLHGGSQSGQ